MKRTPVLPILSKSLQIIANHCKLILLVVLGLPMYSYGQPNNNQDQPDYYLTYNEYMNYFNANPGLFDEEDGSWQAFQRWVYFWRSRTGTIENPGSYEPMIQPLLQMFNGNSTICNSSTIPDDGWELLGPVTVPPGTQNQGIGRVDRLIVAPGNPDHVYAATAATGLWKTTNGTSDSPVWNCLTDNTRLPALGIKDIAIPVQNPMIIYIATGLGYPLRWGYGIGLLKSEDGGASWNATGLMYSPNWLKTVEKVFINPDDEDVIFALSGDQIHKSNDAGDNFTVVSSLNNSNFVFNDMVFKSDDSEVIFATATDNLNDAGGAKIVRSTDGGDTWTVLNLTSIGQSFIQIEPAVTEAEPGTIYFVGFYQVGTNSFEYLFSTGDLGTTWTIINSSTNFGIGGTGFGKLDFAISPNDENVMYVGGVRLWKSINHGVSFTTTGSNTTSNANYYHDDVRYILVLPQEENETEDFIMIGTDGGIAKALSPLNATSIPWTDKSGTGLSVTQFYGIDIARDNSYLVGGTQDNGTIRYGSGIWSNTGGHTDSYNARIENHDITRSYYIGWGSGPLFMNLSTDSGNSWTWQSNQPQALDPAFEIGPSDQVYLSLNDLQRWENQQWTILGNINAGVISAHAIGSEDENTHYVSMKGPWDISGVPLQKLYKTINANASNPGWTDLTVNTDVQTIVTGREILAIEVDPSHPERLWVGTSRFSDNERVWFSENGGIDWVNVSAGLPPFPVNTIVYQKGSDDALYVGTDVGVFYNPHASDPESEWQCFNKDFPVALVNELIINYCTNKIVASTFGRGIWQADLMPATKHITQNTTWDVGSVNYVYTDLIIDPGVTLTVKGTAFISVGKTIRVEKTARLIVDGGVLSNDCGKLWRGIEVVGEASQDQELHSGQYYQGYAKFIDGAIVEHSELGVMGYGYHETPNGGYGIDDDATGGIIEARHAVFKNNYRAVSLYNYEYALPGGAIASNRSIFDQCQFLVNDDLHTNSAGLFGFLCVARLNLVRGVRFLGCEYSDLRTVSPYDLKSGHGILSFDASFLVLPSCEPQTDPCEAPIRSVFRGLNHAIDAGAASGVYNYVVDMADFKRNAYGVYSSAVNNATIIRSSFDVGDKVNVPKPQGIYINTGTGYIIEENDFYSDGYVYTPTGRRPIGTRVRDTGSEANTIYKNTFDELYAGNVAEKTNHNTDPNFPGSGLQYHCNDNPDIEGNYYDFYLGTNDQVARFQGAPENLQGEQDGFAARNTFNLHTTPLYSDYRNTQTGWIYNYFLINPQTVEDPVNYNSTLFTKINLTTNSNECKSNIKEDEEERNAQRNFDTPETPIAILNDSIAVLIALHDSQIDGGNTDSLLTQLANASLASAQVFYMDLMELSPWLSSEILMAVLNMEGVLSEDQILDLLSANPDASLNEPLFDYLTAQTDPVATNIADSLSNLDFNLTDRTKLEARIALLLTQRNRLVNGLISIYEQDSVWQPQLITDRLLEKGSIEAYYGLVDLNLGLILLPEAQSLMDSLPVLFSLNPDQAVTFMLFKKIKSILIAAKSEGRNASELNESEINDLIEIADSDSSLAGSQARAILNFYYDGQYHIEPDFEEEVQTVPMLFTVQDIQQQVILSENDISLSVFPNPAKGKVTFQYIIPDGIEKVSIEIFDANGKLIFKHYELQGDSAFEWNIENILPGIYFWKLLIDNKLLSTDRLVIIK
jgi:hypothetical protein